jgi:hypothetical protein
MMDKDFYIYEWFNVETGEVFYVGKGTKNRFKNTTKRNKYFKNYFNKYKCDVRKVKTKLTEEEAFALEIELIEKYKSIDQCKTNLTLGGEGCRFEEGSWNDLFRKLQYIYCVRNRASIMSNVEDYNPKNLKNKTLEELEELWDDYESARDGLATYRFLFEEGEVGWECLDD